MATIQEFAEVFEAAQRERLARECPKSFPQNWPNAHAKVTLGRVYTKVDFDGSGKYMVENSTGVIFGIKGYGQVHKGYRYGTLDTIDEYDWSGYAAVRRH